MKRVKRIVCDFGSPWFKCNCVDVEKEYAVEQFRRHGAAPALAGAAVERAPGGAMEHRLPRTTVSETTEKDSFDTS